MGNPTKTCSFFLVSLCQPKREPSEKTHSGAMWSGSIRGSCCCPLPSPNGSGRQVSSAYARRVTSDRLTIIHQHRKRPGSKENSPNLLGSSKFRPITQSQSVVCLISVLVGNLLDPSSWRNANPGLAFEQATRPSTIMEPTSRGLFQRKTVFQDPETSGSK